MSGCVVPYYGVSPSADPVGRSTFERSLRASLLAGASAIALLTAPSAQAANTTISTPQSTQQSMASSDVVTVTGTGTITVSGATGVLMNATAATLINRGFISGNLYGVASSVSSTNIIRNTGGTITSSAPNGSAKAAGVALTTGGTLVNYGTITIASTVTNTANSVAAAVKTGTTADPVSITNGGTTSTSRGLISSTGLTGTTNALYLGNGGRVLNQKYGTISSAGPGGAILARTPGSSFTLTNYGTISNTGSGDAIYGSSNDHSIINKAGGVITSTAGDGIRFKSTRVSVDNAGTITGRRGVYLADGGKLKNTGIITGTGGFGVGGDVNPGSTNDITVTNTGGTIQGTGPSSNGVRLTGTSTNGTLINDSNATSQGKITGTKYGVLFLGSDSANLISQNSGGGSAPLIKGGAGLKAVVFRSIRNGAILSVQAGTIDGGVEFSDSSATVDRKSVV